MSKEKVFEWDRNLLIQVMDQGGQEGAQARIIK